MNLRPCTAQDLPQVQDIIRQTQAIFKAQGIDQWQNGYSSEQTLQNDLVHNWGRVAEQDGQIAAYFALVFENDPNYTLIENGTWRTPGPYAVLHRLAVRQESRRLGLAGQIFDFWEQEARQQGFASLRADTHADNIPMQSVLKKRGFLYCGVIYVSDGTPRLAFEKPL